MEFKGYTGSREVQRLFWQSWGSKLAGHQRRFLNHFTLVNNLVLSEFSPQFPPPLPLPNTHMYSQRLIRPFSLILT